jgi:hypothetical protein
MRTKGPSYTSEYYYQSKSLSLILTYQAFCVILAAPGLAVLDIPAEIPIGTVRSELKAQHWGYAIKAKRSMCR